MAASESYAGLRDRDYFHIMLNLDSFEDFLPTARELAERFLAAAREQQEDPALESILKAFPYSQEAFEARLDEIYDGLVEDVERYEASQSWTMRRRDDVIEWLHQMAPFNQTDGSWLRNIAPVGPIDDVRSLLFRIWVDELGGGDPELNHPNLYTALLDSAGLHLPDVRSRQYAEDPDVLDSAFTQPLFQLVLGEFPQDYLPELLGMTQYLEWSSVELKNAVRLHEHFGLDPHYYEVHVAIDNAATGHGAMARDAIERYLEHTRVSGGEHAMQAEWERIWNGYVAFATTGTLADDMRTRRLEPPEPAEQVAAIIRNRAAKGSLNHGQKRLTGELINDLFAEPETFMAALVEGGMIVPGDPERSPFFQLVTSAGPMFKIFTDGELATWRAWTVSLAAEAPPASPVVNIAVAPELTSAEAMRSLIDAMRSRQDGVPAHQGATLTGPDPANAEQAVTQPVAWWFGQPTPALMRALATSENGLMVPGQPDDSPFVTDLLRGANAMGRAFSAMATDDRGSTWIEVVERWIVDGCPIPDDESARPLSLLSPPERLAAHPTGRIHGSGSVH